MKTYSFIGTDKNAGKTTVFNFVYERLREKNAKVCLTSAGINGEEFDNLEGHIKPKIIIHKNGFFVTSTDQLKNLGESYKKIQAFIPPHFKKNYILGKMLKNTPLILEGPNEKNELLKLKKYINDNISPDYLMIDGSVDRQFLGDPKISDEFFFAILTSRRLEQQRKAEDFIYSLSLKPCNKKILEFIDKNAKRDTKSILFDPNGKIIYHGTKIPFLDASLKEICLKRKNSKLFLYLNGALSKTLASSLSGVKNLHIILDNFTQYQSIRVKDEPNKAFLPALEVKNPVNLAKIFIKEEEGSTRLRLPSRISVYNLFKDNLLGIKL